MKVVVLLVSFFVSSVLCGQSKDVEVFHEQNEDLEIKIFARNNSPVPQSVEVTGTIKGMNSSTELPIIELLEPRETKLITTLTRKKDATSFAYNYQYTFIQGDVNAIHNDDYVYQLPFKKGTGYLVGQGYNEHPTHMNQYAIDFNMDQGTEICAIREGVVMQVVDRNTKGCPREECSKYNNFVLIRHEDGSIADYSHLQKNGSLVAVGETVKIGQPIGLSGATGWASGAHLHLEVYVMRFTGQQSVKVEYYLDNSTVGIPQSMQTYYQEL